MLSLIASAAILKGQSSGFSLGEVDLSSMSAGWGTPQKDQSVESHPLTISGQKFDHGVGTHALSEITLKVAHNAKSFHAMVGLDDETLPKRGAAQFELFADGKKVADSGEMHTGDPAKSLDADLSKASFVKLVVVPIGDGISYDHADWADATFILTDPKRKPAPLTSKGEPTMPIAHIDLNRTRLNGATVIGCTPGRDFIFRIAASGARPLKFEVTGLPKSIALDATTGVLRGQAPDAGTFEVSVKVSGPGGTSSGKLRVVSGDHKLALTPPMGWNSWNVWGTSVTAAKVRAAADAFQSSHLADFGYTFVNIDDAWEGPRDSDGNVTTNEKFGDMAALASYVHNSGLKLGIYSSPGPTTCAGYTGSYEHEREDAQTYAKWGVDYLKYDWCSFGQEPHAEGLPGYEQPYATMRTALDQAPRDIVYSLCQYGMGDVYKWGHSDVGGNLWRTTGDINDSWSSMSEIGFSHSVRSTYVKPGGWNDPDMLVVGKLGWGDHPRPTHLTQNEQITHISLWCLLAAPLMIGCDLTQLDSFTADLLMNPEVLAVDQDPLGHAAVQVHQDGDLQIWARPLEDGGYAVGLFNLGPTEAKIHTDWSRDLKVEGFMKVRELWRRRDAGRSKGYTGKVASHGALLLKVSK